MNTIKKGIGLWGFLTLFGLGNIVAQSQFTEKVSMSNVGNKNGTYYLLLCQSQSKAASKMSGTIFMETAINDTTCYLCNNCGIEIIVSSTDNKMLINNLCSDVNASILTVQYGGNEYFAVELVGIMNVADISFTGIAENKSLLLVNENAVTVNNNSRSGALTSAGDLWETSTNGSIYYNGGNVGIGTMFPTSKLHINNGKYTDASILATSSENNELIVRSEYTQPINCVTFSILQSFSGNRNNGFINFHRGQSTGMGFLSFGTNGIERMRISPNGNVGIGTTTPAHLLTVAGIIGAREVKVETNMGADFVFAPDYPLLPLSELEQFIAANKRLPDIAPADTMIQNGVNMGEFQIQLLQKIEELTLYVIEQQKQIDAQNERMKELEAKLQTK